MKEHFLPAHAHCKQLSLCYNVATHHNSALSRAYQLPSVLFSSFRAACGTSNLVRSIMHRNASLCQYAPAGFSCWEPTLQEQARPGITSDQRILLSFSLRGRAPYPCIPDMHNAEHAAAPSITLRQPFFASRRWHGQELTLGKTLGTPLAPLEQNNSWSKSQSAVSCTSRTQKMLET